MMYVVLLDNFQCPEGKHSSDLMENTHADSQGMDQDVETTEMKHQIASEEEFNGEHLVTELKQEDNDEAERKEDLNIEHLVTDIKQEDNNEAEYKIRRNTDFMKTEDVEQIPEQTTSSEDVMNDEVGKCESFHEEMMEDIKQPGLCDEGKDIQDEMSADTLDHFTNSQDDVHKIKVESVYCVQDSQLVRSDVFSENHPEHVRNIEESIDVTKGLDRLTEDSGIVHEDGGNTKMKIVNKNGDMYLTLRKNLVSRHTVSSLSCENLDTCDGHGVGLTKLASLNTHRKKYKRKQSNKCHVSSLGVTCSNNIKKHKSVHTRKTFYTCVLCNSVFVQLRTIERHMDQHTVDRPYRCDVCGDAFSHNDNLRIHEATHAEKKPYKCDVCGEAYSHSINLRVHKRTHTEKKTYKCDAFTQTPKLQINTKVPAIPVKSQTPVKKHYSQIPMNIEDVLDRVHDKRSSVKFLQERGIIHSLRLCSNSHEMVMSLKYHYDRWRCHTCRQNISVRVGTWLQGSNLRFRQIILFIYWWSKELTSISFCQTELGIGKNTTIRWNNNIREVCMNTLVANPVVIGGPNTTVEIDECVFTTQTNKVSRVFPQKWVFGGICRETGDCFMIPVEDTSVTTLMPIIAERIRPGTTVISDKWREYHSARTLPDRSLQTVLHSVNFISPETGAHAQNIERCWRSAKERNHRQCGTHRHMFQSYMCEFMWRNSIKLRNLDPFNAILHEIAQFWPPV